MTFFRLAANDRGYAHLRYPLYGMFHLRERSLSPIDKVNAGTKLPEYTSASQ